MFVLRLERVSNCSLTALTGIMESARGMGKEVCVRGGAVEVMQLCTIGGWPEQWRRSRKTEGGEIDSERREGGGRGV